ncbi:hypothetical protein [Runella zeae]|nr:hypothetical protein [Runella zeae]
MSFSDGVHENVHFFKYFGMKGLLRSQRADSSQTQKTAFVTRFLD